MSDNRAPLPLVSSRDSLGGVAFACKKDSFLTEFQIKPHLNQLAFLLYHAVSITE